MAIELNPGVVSTVATLTTSRAGLVDGDGRPAGGDWLEITWGKDDQDDQTKVVRVEFDGSDGSVGSDPIDLAPGPLFQRLLWVKGCGPLGISGTSGFDVAIRLLR